MDEIRQLRAFIESAESGDGKFKDVLMAALDILEDAKPEAPEKDAKTAFIAMAYADKWDSVREALKKGIEKAGYTPVIMDEIEHNEQIIGKMFELIGKASFVVAELSALNNGVFYESGYAEGLGKEVIHVCRKDVFEESIHFDVRQKSTLLWDKGDEGSLADMLCKHIKSSIEETGVIERFGDLEYEGDKFVYHMDAEMEKARQKVFKELVRKADDAGFDDYKKFIEKKQGKLEDIPVRLLRSIEFKNQFLDEDDDRYSKKGGDYWARFADVSKPSDLGPIQVIKKGDVYYIVDGHHRAAVAYLMNFPEIKAKVYTI